MTAADLTEAIALEAKTSAVRDHSSNNNWLYIGYGIVARFLKGPGCAKMLAWPHYKGTLKDDPSISNTADPNVALPSAFSSKRRTVNNGWE